jgi:hypothetical protein
MANKFTSALKNNIGTAFTIVYKVPVEKRAICIELDVCNTSNSSVTCDVIIRNNLNEDFYVVKHAPVPVGGSLQVISGQKIVLDEDKQIMVMSSLPTSLDVICSILEDI